MSGRAARAAAREPGRPSLAVLGNRLVFHHEIGDQRSEGHTLVNGKCTALWDRAGSAHVTPYVNPVPYFASGGPGNQPYLKNTDAVLYNESLSSQAANYVLADEQRLEFYAVCRLATGAGTGPIVLYQNDGTRYPFFVVGGGTSHLQVSASGADIANYQELDLGVHGGAWVAVRVAYLSTRAECLVNGILTSPNFTFSGPCKCPDPLWFDMLYKQGDAIAFDCCVRNPDANTRAIVSRYVWHRYRLRA